MALEKTVQTEFGFTAENAYHKIGVVKISKKNVMHFNADSYTSKNAQKPFFSEGHVCGYDLTGANPIAQAYAHIKTLPEFAGATDC